MTLSSRFDAVNEVTFAHNSDQRALVVNHRYGADAVGQKYIGDLLDRCIGSYRDHFGNHDIGSFHSTALSRWLIPVSNSGNKSSNRFDQDQFESRPRQIKLLMKMEGAGARNETRGHEQMEDLSRVCTENFMPNAGDYVIS